MVVHEFNDSAALYVRNSGFHHWLATVRLSRVVALLLVVLVIVPLVTHYYLSKVATGTANPDVHHTRLKLEAIEEPGVLKTSDLKLRVEELLRIKVSVANELRDLENKRQHHLAEISLYNQKIEELKVDVNRYQQELERFKLSLEQAKYAQKEALKKSTPELQAPRRILPSLEEAVILQPPSGSAVEHCRMHLCFDHSRCSLTSGFPVYYYNPEDDSNPVAFHLEPSLRVLLTYALSVNAHITYDPNIACIFIVLLRSANGANSSPLLPEMRHSLEQYLHSLAHWHGDGRNHILLNLDSGPSVLLDGVQTGRAMVVQSSFQGKQFRPGFDVVVPSLALPPSIQNGNLWNDLPSYSPARRKYLMVFHGEMQYEMGNTSLPSPLEQKHVEFPPSNNSGKLPDTKQSLAAAVELKGMGTTAGPVMLDVVEMLKKMQREGAVTDDNFFFKFVCSEEKTCGLPSEWCVCGYSNSRRTVLQDATFSLIIAPANWSLISTSLTHLRLSEALQQGAVPVILGDHVQLPFGEFVDWSRAVVFLPNARLTEMHFLIRTFTDGDILFMRHHGRLIWERYLSSTQAIVDTIVATFRSRLKIPALPARQEPSPNVYNATFVPLKLDTLLPEIDPDESVGPTEPPYPSPTFRRNFTSILINSFEIWNRWLDPFYSYPYTPFDPILPSEAKFLGSGVGFRAIGHGAGGSGKEFNEALGGNVPREQFSIVMLTFEREAVLINSLQRLYGLPHLNKVIVVWNSPRPPSEDLRWPDIGVPIHVIKAKKNSLNNRFLPYDAIETEAVLSVDDDAHLRHDEIMFGFRVWREARDRIVGFPGRYHAWDLKHGGWLYNSNYSCELSMVLTGAAFFHKYYSYLYTNLMPQAIRDKVDEYMNCEDIAMNFLVSHVTRKPPLKVTSRWTFRCPGCPVALSEDDTHFQERHRCINYFVKVYGYMPLLNTQFRVDSVLFKTRLPHDKQKCFKFI